MTRFSPSAIRSLSLGIGVLAVSLAVTAAPSTTLSVTGKVQVPKVYDASSIVTAGVPVDQTVGFLSGTTPQTHSYTGVGLWGLLGASGVVVDPAVRNDILNRYVVATGTDGYQVVFSLGELSPNFGNRGNVVAYAETIGGTSAPLGAADGFVRVTAPGDVRGGRYVSNLTSLDVRSSGSTTASIGGGPTTSFAVSGAVTHAMSFDLAALQALPTITQTIGGHTFVGASFWDLLSTTVGIALDPAVRNDVLGKYVVATGSDGYKSVFSLGELSPLFGGGGGTGHTDFIAYEEDGVSLATDGFARLIVPDDIAHGRWVSNLTQLEIFSAAPIPEPETCALMLAGLALVGAASRRGAVRTSRRVP